jgi:hypothetical protein
MSWANTDADLNAAGLSEFGEPVVYQAVLLGVAVGAAITIAAIRRSRVRDESGVQANFEEIELDPAGLASPPVRGDWVTAWGDQYSVGNVSQADPYGLVTLTLLQRAG